MNLIWFEFDWCRILIDLLKVILSKFSQWISWFSQRWRTQRNAIRSANCKTQWIIKILNANCAPWLSLGACFFENQFQFNSNTLRVLSWSSSQQSVTLLTWYVSLCCVWKTGSTFLYCVTLDLFSSLCMSWLIDVLDCKQETPIALLSSFFVI